MDEQELKHAGYRYRRYQPGSSSWPEMISSILKDVNWNMIFMIAGMGMYCIQTLGVVDTLGQAMQSLPAFLIAPYFALLGSALSFVTSAATTFSR